MKQKERKRKREWKEWEKAVIAIIPEYWKEEMSKPCVLPTPQHMGKIHDKIHRDGYISF